MTVRVDIFLALLTVYAMLGEARVLQQIAKKICLETEGSNNYNRRVDVKYYLHTRGNEGNPTELEDPDGTPDVSGTPYSSSRQTKFIIHGFKSSGKEQWILNMANALLQAEDVNVFAVDWRKGASPGWTLCPYRAATENCRTVGQTVGKFVHQLGQPASMTHIIGHSLGAHAAGFAGKAAKSRGLTVARISGLDPAGPRFEGVPAADRLDRGDATFVDVIHTDTAKLGFGKPIGHVDFYPNEGWVQPGCRLRLRFCSHSRAYEFYTESINSGCRFLTRRCRDWETFHRERGQCDSCSLGLSDGACSVMGYPAINYPNSHGSMYLVTNDNPEPHCGTSHRGRVKREAGSGESTQCVQSLRTDMRQEIRDYMDSITDIQEMGLEADFCSMYSEMDAVVVNITADEPNCGPEDTPIIMEYIGDGKYDSIMAWAEDKCPGSGGASTLPSSLLVFALQFTAVVAVFLCFAKVKFPNRCPGGLLALMKNK